MKALGHIAQLWRYPVKSMQGEQCASFEVGLYGIDGDRRFAFESVHAPVGKPLLRSFERSAMLRARAAHHASGEITVRVPAGQSVSLHDASLPSQLGLEPASSTGLQLQCATLPFTDVRPISLHSLATEQALEAAFAGFDPRRLRSNIVLDLTNARPFAEDLLAGKSLRLGELVTLKLLERIPRCRMVSLHPETAEMDPSILRWLAREHDGRAGIYARSLATGTVSVGDAVSLVD